MKFDELTPAWEGEAWYRVEDHRTAPSLDEWENPIPGSGRLHITIYPYRVLRHTPKGVWLEDHTQPGGRFVLKDSRKRFACPTKEEAIESFIARKRRQCEILKAQLDHVERVLTVAGASTRTPTFDR